MTEYPYGAPPDWWGKGRSAAGQAAYDAKVFSVAISDKLRYEAGKGDVLDLRPAVRRLFATEAEQAEAYRLLDLAEWIRRKRVTALDGGLFAEAVTDGN